MQDWYDIDELRESWCFLAIDTRRSDPTVVDRWELGDGNMDQLVQTEAGAVDETQSRTDIHHRLTRAIADRQSADCLLITDSEETLRVLRTLMVTIEGTPSTLRGFRHVSIESVIDGYFEMADLASLADRLSSANSSRDLSRECPTTSQLWAIWTSIAPLIPVEALRGEHL